LLKETCMDLVMAMVRYDVRGVTRALLQIGIATEHVNREEFRRDVSRLQQKYYGMPLSQIEMGQALGELVQLSFKYSVRVPPELSLIVKMLMTMEGLIIQLNPELSIVDIAEPFGREILRSRMSVRKMGQGIWEMVLDHYHAARNLPREMESVMSLLEEGELKIKMEHVNLRRMASTIDVITNRIVLAIIIASIIMGASMLVSSSRETFVPGVPLVQIGLGVGVVLGLFLAYSIIRSGRY
ncbi:MAG: AarF/ABC1/UbiB kinase family protein, partial [Syntrophomonadaceae bacterium]|nr:AarF/ABC1/UbiB kinase family protein [Syntrophomonadaceae bacterium]